jgi:hypothetical protein
MAMAHQAFISYSSVDSNIVFKMVEVLENAGIVCWVAPRDIPLGSTYAASIIQAIKMSAYFIFIFSSASNASDAVVNEIEKASTLKGLTIIPFKLENLPYSDSLEYYLRSKQNIIAYGRPPAEAIDELVRYIKSHLSFSTEANYNLPAEEHPGTSQTGHFQENRPYKKRGLFVLGGILLLAFFFIIIISYFYAPNNPEPPVNNGLPTDTKVPEGSAGGAEKGQVDQSRNINVTVSSPYTIGEGEEGQITILAYTDQNLPVVDANIKISFGGGYFMNSGTSTEIGKTDAAGKFSTNWRSPNPAAAEYAGTLIVTKDEMTEYKTGISIKIASVMH